MGKHPSRRSTYCSPSTLLLGGGGKGGDGKPFPWGARPPGMLGARGRGGVQRPLSYASFPTMESVALLTPSLA